MAQDQEKSRKNLETKGEAIRALKTGNYDGKFKVKRHEEQTDKFKNLSAYRKRSAVIVN